MHIFINNFQYRYRLLNEKYEENLYEGKSLIYTI